MKKNNQKTTQRSVSIRWKLIVYFAVFVAVALLVMWVFQVYLLNNFYELIKRRAMTHSASELAAYIEDEALDVHAYDCAMDGVMSIAIYRMDRDAPVQVLSIDATGQTTGIKLPTQLLTKYYQKAAENEGSYTGHFTFGGVEISGRAFPTFRFQQNDSPGARLLHMRLAQGNSGSIYLILLDAAPQPLATTVEILQTQFLWILSILLVCAGVMVFYLYRHISSPLVKMNEAAKQLAYGKYDVEFSGEGYRETRELADTLNYASYELSRLDRLQKELIANISHDLRTPLTMIKGYSEIMRDIPGENSAENIQVVIDETTRLSELVNDLLDLSKIQSGSRKAMFEEFDLTAAVEEVMNRYDAFTAHQGYHITFTAEERATVFADRGMILQVLYNLINNAINYTGDDLSVTVEQTVQNNRVRISVADTGQGIAEDEIPQIWDRYYKVDKVHRRAMIGTGLGLSIVKGVLELHNAAYGVQSQVGVGSTFWFELDILDSAQETRETIEQLEE
ncbi:MAG: HAMP domain-containing histidine kinase [Ruminococcaceae bacterium]|nr:HAMP domain-containing histidine kinase [Oscillospiraceae bacterium]